MLRIFLPSANSFSVIGKQFFATTNKHLERRYVMEHCKISDESWWRQNSRFRAKTTKNKYQAGSDLLQIHFSWVFVFKLTKKAMRLFFKIARQIKILVQVKTVQQAQQNKSTVPIFSYQFWKILT